jgi:hypothetical protein
MKVFENFEKEGNENQKLSFAEKTIITILIPLGKVLLWRIGRAKTYGDLKKIMAIIDAKMNSLEDNTDEKDLSEEEGIEVVTDLVDSIKKDIEKFE